jgi:hypothetical protein
VAFAWNVAEALRHREVDSEAMLWRPTRGVLVTRVIGHANVDLLRFYITQAEREMRGGPLRVPAMTRPRATSSSAGASSAAATSSACTTSCARRSWRC